ncbi:uracil DNA N-glycosylase Thp1 [Marasmius sp. AFHP31]|nr:uracil DNA N-glycosylase Thp1 [Marasmius sp. AFHP31]
MDGVSQDDDGLRVETVLSFQQTLSKFSYSSAEATDGKPVPRLDSSKLLNRNASPSKPRQSAKRKRVWSDEDGETPFGMSSREASPKKPKMKRTSKRRHADPEKYSHLRQINDCLQESLDVVFCGINPGQLSAETGHHFAHPSNHFWKCLHLSGLTPERIPPTEDYTIPHRFSLGLTNMVDRPTAEASPFWLHRHSQTYTGSQANELKDSEMKGGIPTFLQKMGKYHPRIVAYVGLHMARLVHNYVLKNESTLTANADSQMPRIIIWDRDLKVFKPGLQCYKIVYEEPGQFDRIPETFFYALPCTSGRVQGYQISDKVAFFSEIQQKLEDMKSEAAALPVRTTSSEVS